VNVDGSASTDSDGTILTYQWRRADDTVLANGVTAVLTDLPVGTNEILLVVRDDDGEPNTDSLLVTVTAMTTTPPPQG